ncbi:MAG: PHP domain-containing protein [Candidatus Bathyarchaeia archaeon]|nr:PHP domain-containing protein [Candidatus Bathyarchaeia archaeon]MDI6905381.1 PHP domain-containing protein [Candidatus Bathyarchaeia archaeon]
MIKADLHTHTIYSFDASIHPKTIVDQLYAHPSIKAVAITDHNTIEGYYKVRKLASAYQDILIIPGVEVSAVEGDLTVLGVAELPPKPWTVENVVDFTKERGGLVVVAHPYRAYGLGDLAKNYDFDAIEVLNGISAPHVNKMAENLAKAMGLPGVAGSDAHRVHELWTVYTEVQASSDADEILKAIKKGLVRVASTRKSIHF